MIDDDDMSPKELIKRKICPPWWVVSRPFLKRCVPDFSQKDGNDIDESTVLVKKANTQDETGDINVSTVKSAVTNLAKMLDYRSFGEKVFSDFADTWWIVLLLLLFAMVLSLLWIFLMR